MASTVHKTCKNYNQLQTYHENQELPTHSCPLVKNVKSEFVCDVQTVKTNDVSVQTDEGVSGTKLSQPCQLSTIKTVGEYSDVQKMQSSDISVKTEHKLHTIKEELLMTMVPSTLFSNKQEIQLEPNKKQSHKTGYQAIFNFILWV